MTVIDLTLTTKLKPERKKTACRCARVVVLEYSRMLECQNCGATIDPFDFLWKQAQVQQNSAFDITIKRQEIERLSSEIDELKKVKHNLKAQVRRMQRMQRGTDQ